MWLKRLIVALLLSASLWAQHSVPLSETLTTTPSITALKNQASPTEFFCVNDSVGAVTGGHHPGLRQAPSVNLTWSAATADWYSVYRGTVSGGPYSKIISCIRGTTFTDVNVVPGTPYFYVVTATYLGNESAYSPEVRAGVWPDAQVGRTQVLLPRSLAVVLTTTPSIAVRQTLRRQTTDPLTTSAAVALAQALARHPAETLGTSDAISITSPHNKSVGISESVSESDAIARSTRDARAPSETFTTTAAITTVRRVMARTIGAESLTTSDSAGEQQGLQRGSVETLFTQDTPTVSSPTQVWVTYSGTAVYSSGPGTIPSTLFGLHFRFNQAVPTSPPYAPGPTILNWPGVPFGSLRLWDTDTRWQTLEQAQGVFTWTNLDNYLRAAKFNGVNDVMLTLSSTPNWAATTPSAAPCDFGPANGFSQTGDCSPPSDLNSDGTGTNQNWRDFIFALGQHLAGLDPTTYSPVSWFEMWNEFTRTASWLGTDAQLVRMAQDANCILTGRAITISATGQTCSPGGMNEPLVGTLPAALVLTPSAVPQSPDLAIFGTYLATSGAMQDVDLIGVHANAFQGAGTTSPDSYSGTGVLSNPASLESQWLGLTSSLPDAAFGLRVWSTQGSWGVSGNLSDPDMQKGFVARYYLDAWSMGFQRAYWYGANNTWGTLWLQNGENGCNDGGSGGGCATAPAVAWQQVYGWMVGNSMTQSCAPDMTGNIWTCALVTPTGKQLLAVWDASKTCSSGVCTTSTYSIPTGPNYTQYFTLDNGVAIPISSSTVSIGWKPILLTQ